MGTRVVVVTFLTERSHHSFRTQWDCGVAYLGANVYAEPGMSRLRRYRHSLRTALLVLLAFGLMVTPILDQLGDLHSVEHAAMDAAVAHGHAQASDLVAADHPHGDQGDSDHSDGSHGLLHLYTSVTVALPDTMVQLFPPPAVCALLPIPAALLLPRDPSSLPFRPPIV